MFPYNQEDNQEDNQDNCRYNTPPEYAQTARSSSNQEFILLSEIHQMTEHTGIYSNDAYNKVCEYVKDKFLDSKNLFQILFCDFEGEMLGPSGLLTLATFMHVDVNRPGLLVDMTCPQSRKMAKTILECKHLQKIGWGLEFSDLPSLMHHPDASFRIHPNNLVDIQLLFSESDKKRMRLQKAMDIMREIHPEHMEPFPNKDCIQWDRYYSQNRRVYQYPLSEKYVKYATDDVIIISLITYFANSIWWNINHSLQLMHRPLLQTSWYDTLHASELIQQKVHDDAPHERWFFFQLNMFKKSSQHAHMMPKQLAQTVSLKRYIMSMRKQYGNMLQRKISPYHLRSMKQCEVQVNQILEKAHVTIPDDLSFYE